MADNGNRPMTASDTEIINTNFKNNLIIMFREIKVRLKTWKVFKK